ncbi:heterokaryon incompatibility protein-domain-containing protein, partial [Immersiella caudata]
MQLCTESHGECGDSSGNDAFTPKRLIEVFPNEHTGGALHWKLTTWERPVPQPRPRYLTLSHCWGSSLHTCLLKASLSAFTAVPSPAATLPKTYQDAMSVTDSLGFRYVWIDSLCIIQDDTDDWKTQSAEMGRVYQHTSCNIAAAWAKEGSQGCFSARDPAAAIEPIRTSISIEAGGEVRLLAFDMIQRWKWLSSVVDSPLNQRGWVLQERYMSPRQLTFARDEVFWECRQLAASESHPGGLPPVLFLPEGTDVPLSSKPRLECVDELTLRRNWMELVEKYTASKLTVHTDKLIALAGLAGEARMMFGGDEYLAGMWRRDLHKQLVWYASLSTSSQPRAEKAAYLAPSWCWSS